MEVLESVTCQQGAIGRKWCRYVLLSARPTSQAVGLASEAWGVLWGLPPWILRQATSLCSVVRVVSLRSRLFRLHRKKGPCHQQTCRASLVVYGLQPSCEVLLSPTASDGSDCCPALFPCCFRCCLCFVFSPCTHSHHVPPHCMHLYCLQVIDVLAELTARGLHPDTAAAVLDDAGLAIGLSFWVAGAPDPVPSSGGSMQASRHERCSPGSSSSSSGGRRPAGQQSPAQFAAALMLDGGQVPLKSFQTFVRNDSSHHFFSKRLAVDPADGWRRWVLSCCCVCCAVRS
jgi:hypothetical protein